MTIPSIENSTIHRVCVHQWLGMNELPGGYCLELFTWLTKMVDRFPSVFTTAATAKSHL